MELASKKRKKKIRKSIPWGLHMAIVKLQWEEELEYDEACVRAAKLIDVNNPLFKEAVGVEANRLYKSRLMKEMNKAKNTWYNNGYVDGEKAGFAWAEKEHRITYPCSKCGGELVLRPENDDTKSAIEFLKSKGWRHTQCP